MTAVLSQRLGRDVSKVWRSLLAFGVTDETFSVAVMREEKNMSPHFILGLNVISFTAWNVGTWLGLFFAGGLPEIIKTSMGIALYAMFIGLLIPSVKSSRQMLTVSLLAVLLHSMVTWFPAFSALKGGWGVILATVFSAALGAAFFSEGEP